MTIYGQDVTDQLVFASDLVVDCECPHLVAISSHIGHVSYLTRKDVEALGRQLRDWLFANRKGREKCKT